MVVITKRKKRRQDNLLPAGSVDIDWRRKVAQPDECLFEGKALGVVRSGGVSKLHVRVTLEVDRDGSVSPWKKSARSFLPIEPDADRSWANDATGPVELHNRGHQAVGDAEA